MKRTRVVVHGRVIGVFFRDATRQRAGEQGVNGWVRNTPEGNLEAVFEGEPDRIARLVRFCEHGPRGARVERVEMFEEKPEGLEGFEIR